MADLVLSDLVKSYDRRHPPAAAASGRFKPGTLTVLVGENGSGKTTLLRTIAGAIRPTSGSASRLDTVAFAPEKLLPPARMTAVGYLRRLAAIKGVAPHLRTLRAVRLTRVLGLEPGPRTRLGDLSKGNLQKIAIAQAFLSKADLVLLDEPRSGLDWRANAALDLLIEDAVARGAIVVVTSHSDRIFPKADSVLELVGGGLVDRSSQSEATVPTFSISVLKQPDSTEWPVFASTSIARIGAMTVSHVSETDLDQWLAQALDHKWKIVELHQLTREEQQ